MTKKVGKGKLRSDVTALVDLEDNQDAISGYKAGRQWFFEEATPDVRTITDEQLIQRLRELTMDAATWHDPEGVWFFTVGCLLGELSGHLFPLSQEEQRQWEAEAEAAMKEYFAAREPDQEKQELDSETSALVSVLEYTV